MKKVLIYAVCDYETLPTGGEVFLLNNFLRANKCENIEYYLIGLSFNSKDKVGVWSTKKIGERYYKFFPVSQILEEKERTHIPFRLRMVFGINKYWNQLKTINADYHYIHSAELGIPLWNKNLQLIYHVHGDPSQTLKISRFPIFRLKLFSDYYMKIIEMTLKNSFKVVWAADKSKNLYLEKKPNMREIVESKSITIHSSFDTRLIPNGKRLNFLEKRKHFVTVGRLSKIKRIDFLIDVMNNIIKDKNLDVDFIICGGGEEIQTLKNKVRNLKIENNIVFLGYSDRELIATALNESEAFLFASENEAMSLVVLESLYLGTPVISTDVGDISSVIVEGKNGYIIKEYDITQFVDKMMVILNCGKQSYKNDCIKSALEYSPEKMALRINELFSQ